MIKLNYLYSNVWFTHLSEEKYNLSADFCLNIEDHTDDPIYTDIEEEVRIKY